MTPDQWRQVSDLFRELVDRPAPEREEAVLRECDDPEVVKEVLRLMASDEAARSSGFLVPPEMPSTEPDRDDDLDGDGGQGRRNGDDGDDGDGSAGFLRLICPHCFRAIRVVPELPERPESTIVCGLCRHSFSYDSYLETVPPYLRTDRESVGRFRLELVAGQGSYGVVYMALDPSLQKYVALKVPRQGAFVSAKERARFYRDGRLAASLNHPSIVPVHEVGEDGEGVPYIVSEYISGTTLAGRLADRANPYGFREAAGLVATLAGALHHAHGRGVIHRDVKPSNVMIDGANLPLLMDFGLATADLAEPTITTTGRPLGTAAYMAPEQARGAAHEADRRSDVYSLGVVLYEMITGSLPFRGAQATVLHQVIHDEPAPPRSLDVRIPRDLQNVCLMAMAKEPSRRYQSAQEFAEDLTRFVKERPVAARPVGPAERAWKWMKRNPRLAGALAAVALSLMSTAVVSAMLAVTSRGRLIDSKANEAKADLELGRAECDRGEIGPGLHWMARGLAAAGQAGDPDLIHYTRASLAAWSRELPPLKAVFSHAAGVRFAGFSPDGKLAVTGSDDGTARVWDVSTGKPAGPPLTTGKPIYYVGFTARAASVITVCLDGTFQRWAPTTGELLAGPVAMGAQVTTGGLSPDRAVMFVACDDKTVRWLNPETAEPLRPPLTLGDDIYVGTFTPDGKTLAVGGNDKKVTFWDVKGGRPAAPPLDQTEFVRGLAFSPDAKTLLVATLGREARFWDLARREPILVPLTNDSGYSSAAYSPDGETVLTSGWDRTTRLWNARDGRPLGAPFRHQGLVFWAGFSPDGSALLSASGDRTAKVWGTSPPGPFARVITGPGKATGSAWADDGRTVLVAGADGEAVFHAAVTGDPDGRRIRHGGEISVVAVSPDGGTALLGGKDGRARLYRTADGRPAGPEVKFTKEVWFAEFAPDGATAAAVSRDETVRVWDVATGVPRARVIRQADVVYTQLYGAGGKTLLIAGGTVIQLWDVATLTPATPPLLQPRPLFYAALAPDGKTLAAVWADRSAGLWGTASGRLVSPSLKHQGVTHAAFNPQGNTLVTVGNDSTGRLWGATSGLPQGRKLTGHDAFILTVAYSPDGSVVATSGSDGTVRLWDARLGLPIGPPLRHPGQVNALEFGRDGSTLLTLAFDKTVRVWTLPGSATRGADPGRRTGLATGLNLSESGDLTPLDNPSWDALRTAATPAAGPPA